MTLNWLIKAGICILAVFVGGIIWFRMHPEVSSGPESFYWPEDVLLENFTTIAVNSRIKEEDAVKSSISQQDLNDAVLQGCGEVFKEYWKLRNIPLEFGNFKNIFDKHPLSLGLTFYLLPARSSLTEDAEKWEITHRFTRIKAAPRILEIPIDKNYEKSGAFEAFASPLEHPGSQDIFPLGEKGNEKEIVLIEAIKRRCHLLAEELKPNFLKAKAVEDRILKIKQELE